MYHCDETHGKFASVTLHKAPGSTVKLEGRACSNEQTYQRIRRTRFSVNISSFFSFKFIHTCNRHCVCHITLIAYSNAHSIRFGSLRMHPFIYFSMLEFCHEKKSYSSEMIEFGARNSIISYHLYVSVFLKEFD